MGDKKKMHGDLLGGKVSIAIFCSMYLFSLVRARDRNVSERSGLRYQRSTPFGACTSIFGMMFLEIAVMYAIVFGAVLIWQIVFIQDFARQSIISARLRYPETINDGVPPSREPSPPTNEQQEDEIIEPPLEEDDAGENAGPFPEKEGETSVVPPQDEAGAPKKRSLRERVTNAGDWMRSAPGRAMNATSRVAQSLRDAPGQMAKSARDAGARASKTVTNAARDVGSRFKDAITRAEQPVRDVPEFQNTPETSERAVNSVSVQGGAQTSGNGAARRSRRVVDRPIVGGAQGVVSSPGFRRTADAATRARRMFRNASNVTNTKKTSNGLSRYAQNIGRDGVVDRSSLRSARSAAYAAHAVERSVGGGIAREGARRTKLSKQWADANVRARRAVRGTLSDAGEVASKTTANRTSNDSSRNRRPARGGGGSTNGHRVLSGPPSARRVPPPINKQTGGGETNMQMALAQGISPAEYVSMNPDAADYKTAETMRKYNELMDSKYSTQMPKFALYPRVKSSLELTFGSVIHPPILRLVGMGMAITIVYCYVYMVYLHLRRSPAYEYDRMIHAVYRFNVIVVCGSLCLHMLFS